jgi:hypothetical protein
MGAGAVARVRRGNRLGTAALGKLGGRISTGIAKAQRGERPCRGAHVASETTRPVVGFVQSAAFLATTGRGNGRRDGRQLEMTQETRDDRLLGDGGNDPECAAAAQGKVAKLPPPTQWRKTRGHIQGKDSPQ